jgi:hypothetical protein
MADYFYVEIELDGTITAKRCPVFKTPEGLNDLNAIRLYFFGLGYEQVSVIRIC